MSPLKHFSNSASQPNMRTMPANRRRLPRWPVTPLWPHRKNAWTIHALQNEPESETIQQAS